MSAKILSQLNEQQQQAVQATDGPVLVLAGAGSGKTRTLTHRIAYLIAHKLATPQNILAVTFTNKAAGEMRERIARLVGETAASQMTIGTFHSLGARILREQHRHHSRTAGFTILDTSDTERLIRRALEQQNLSPKQWAPRSLRHYISQAKNTGRAPAEAARLAESAAEEVSAATYARYQRLLQQENGFDFDDLLVETLKLLQKEQVPRDHYQRRWTHLSIDEYQDTNVIQDELVRILAKPQDNLCVVGDDYQSIYSWRGAQVDHILHFNKRYPKSTTLYLTQNYRSTGPILAAANQVILQNREQKHKKLWTSREQGSPVAVLTCQSDQSEARSVRAQIQAKLDLGSRKQECAVLYRTNAQSRSFEEELIRAGIPYTVVGGLKFYDRAEIKDALALLTLAANPNSSVSLMRLSRVLLKGIGAKSIDRVVTYAGEKDISLLEALAQPDCLTERQQAGALSFTEAYRGIALDSAPSKALAELLQKSGYLASLKRLPDAEDRRENIEELLNVTEGYPTIEKLLEEVALLTDIDTANEPDDRVLLMTLHAAKGLEFSSVWVVGLEEQLLPHRSSSESPAELAEERRLFYVGMTRAKESLTLTLAEERTIHGERQPQAPSRFLQDLPTSVEHHAETGPISADHLLELNLKDEDDSEPTYQPFEIGDTITHPQFGRGVVIETRGSTVAAVFEGHGVRQIDAAALAT